MKTVIFDIDGTIFDTKKGIVACLNDVLGCYSIKALENDEQDKYIGPSVKDSFMKFHGFDEKKADEATRMYREKYVSSYIEQSAPYEGLLEVLRYIRFKKYKLCIATMKTRKQVDTLLDLFVLKDDFDCIETSRDEGGYTKFDMLNSIKNKYGDGEYIFVGDTYGDYKAALKADMRFIYAKYGYGEIEGCSEEIVTLKDLMKLI